MAEDRETKQEDDQRDRNEKFLYGRSYQCMSETERQREVSLHNFLGLCCGASFCLILLELAPGGVE